MRRDGDGNRQVQVGRGGKSILPFHRCDVRYWHLADNPIAPCLSAIGVIADKGSTLAVIGLGR